MRIGIDICDLATGIVGVGSVIMQQLRYLHDHDRTNDYFLYQNDDTVYCPASNFHQYIARLPLYGYWREQIYFSARALIDRLDIFHAPIHLPPAAVPRRTKIVCTVHDIHAEVAPHLYPPAMVRYFIPRRTQMIKQADAVIVHSHFVKQAIMQHADVAEKKITVIPLDLKPAYAVPATAETCSRVRARYKLPERYLLYVGSIEPWKRVPFLIESFCHYRAACHDEIGLVIVGRSGWHAAEASRVAAAVAQYPFIKAIGYAAQEDLPCLYQQAEAFVSASVWEGFGIIFLEAMAAGIPIVAASAAAIPEVVGDAGFLFDQESQEDCAEKMRLAVQSTPARAQCIAHARSRISRHAPGSYGKAVVHVYQSLGTQGKYPMG